MPPRRIAQMDLLALKHVFRCVCIVHNICLLKKSEKKRADETYADCFSSRFVAKNQYSKRVYGAEVKS